MISTKQISHSPAMDELFWQLDDDPLAAAQRISEMPVVKLERLHQHAKDRRYVHHSFAVLEGCMAFCLWRGHHNDGINPFDDLADTRVLEHCRLLQAGSKAQIHSIYANAWDRRNDGELEYARLAGMALFQMHDGAGI